MNAELITALKSVQIIMEACEAMAENQTVQYEIVTSKIHAMRAIEWEKARPSGRPFWTRLTMTTPTKLELNQTASSIRYQQAVIQVAREHLERFPDQQAEAIAGHYVAHAMIAKDILDMLKLRREIPIGPGYSTVDIDWCIAKSVETIKANHANDLGIELEWPSREKTL